MACHRGGGSDARHLRLCFYCHNAGATAGVLEGAGVVEVVGVDEIFSERPHAFELKLGKDTNPANQRADLPIAFEGGEVRTLYLIGRISFSLTPLQRLVPDEDDDIRREEAFASALGRVERVTAPITWTYIRRASWLDRLLPGRPNTRRTVERTEAHVDPGHIRAHFVRHWKTQGEHPHYGARARRLVTLAGGPAAAGLN